MKNQHPISRHRQHYLSRCMIPVIGWQRVPDHPHFTEKAETLMVTREKYTQTRLAIVRAGGSI